MSKRTASMSEILFLVRLGTTSLRDTWLAEVRYDDIIELS